MSLRLFGFAPPGGIRPRHVYDAKPLPYLPYLAKFAWTPIVRHQVVKGSASPDDPALTAFVSGPEVGFVLRA